MGLKDESVNQSISQSDSDGGDSRTALAKPGLLIIFTFESLPSCLCFGMSVLFGSGCLASFTKHCTELKRTTTALCFKLNKIICIHYLPFEFFCLPNKTDHIHLMVYFTETGKKIQF